MKTPKRTLTVKASEIEKAIKRAKNFCPKDWQAELLEILLIPKVYRRWQYINDRYPKKVEIKRHQGKPWTGDRDEALATEDWLIYSGYEFGYGLDGYCWNRAREDYYGHSPSSAWDGIRRETYHTFAENLRLAYGAVQEGEVLNYRVEQALWDYRIRFINDLTGD